MGTLFNQTQRETEKLSYDFLKAYVWDKLHDDYECLSTEAKIKILRCAIEEQKIKFEIDDANRKDEQLAGFGNLIYELIDVCRDSR